MNAIEQIREKLEQCPSCVSDPKLRSKLLEFIAQGNNGSGVTFIFKERLNQGHCGDTRGITNTTYLSDWKNQFGCYCLPKTIIHELVHQTWKNIFIPGISDWAEKEPDMVDHDCFPLSKCHSWMGAKH